MIVFSFDRDSTVDVGNPPGPIPLEWVSELSKSDIVYAHGNQTLKSEAEIPGVTELREELDDSRGGDARVKETSYLNRLDRVRMVMEANPNRERYICVDDEDLSELEEEGWEYYQPHEFVDVFDEIMFVRGDAFEEDVEPHALELNLPTELNFPAIVATSEGTFVIEEPEVRRALPNIRTQQWLRSEGYALIKLSSEEAQAFFNDWIEQDPYPSRAVGGGWE